MANRMALRQQRLQLRHEREMTKIVNGLHHKRAEEIGKVLQPLTKAVGESVVPAISIVQTLLRAKIPM
jgi:hypothetical protein